jgi:hypothetical protein
MHRLTKTSLSCVTTHSVNSPDINEIEHTIGWCLATHH